MTTNNLSREFQERLNKFRQKDKAAPKVPLGDWGDDAQDYIAKEQAWWRREEEINRARK